MKDRMDIEISEKFVTPVYLQLLNLDLSEIALTSFASDIKDDITDQIIETLLESKGWREKSVAAFYVSIKNKIRFTDNIGNALLKSEYPYSGKTFCLTLAEFNTPKGFRYLKDYLEIYLHRKNLWYDQGDAMAAISYLDTQNNLSETDTYLKDWNEFITDKPNWNLDQISQKFERNLAALKRVKEKVQHNN